MIKIALSGASGKMGQSLKKCIEDSSSGSQSQSKSKSKSDSGSDSNSDSKAEAFFLSAQWSRQNDLESWSPSSIDAVVDFSTPEALKKVASWCQKNQKPLVTGTTGFKNLKDVIPMGPQSPLTYPLMHSSNYSFGVASLIESLKSLKAFSKEATLWIEEYHHKSKKDSPSGTALKLAKAINNHLNKKDFEVHSTRAGSIFGVHQLHLATEEEWVTLTHRALNRHVFSKGALRALTWLKDQAPGVYSLEDFLKAQTLL